MKAPTLLFHFTSRRHLPSILAEGVIRTTDPNLYATGPATFYNPETGQTITKGGPLVGQPVAWFVDLATAEGEHGLATPGYTQATGDHKAAIRIAVYVPDGRQWLQWVKARPHDAEWVRLIVRTGGGRRSARHWFVVPRPVPQAEWIEVRDMDADTVLWAAEGVA